MAKSKPSSIYLFSSLVRIIIILLYLITNFYDCACAQYLERRVIASSGTQLLSPTLTVSGTLGETFVSTLTGTGLILTQGFQQPDLTPCSLQINGGLDTLFACGDAVTLQADSGFSSYSWSSGQTTSGIFATYTGWYTCTALLGGCSASDSIFVSMIKAEIMQPDTSICLGSSINLSVNNANGLTGTLPASLQSGLVGWWPFNGNANDESGNGNNGTVYLATPTTNRFGDLNSAFGFGSGPDKISVANSVQNQLQNSFSISVWIKTLSTTYGTGNEYHAILEKWGGGGNASYLFALTPDGKPYFTTHNFISTFVVGDSALNFNTWYNLTYTHNAGLGMLYVNGILNDSNGLMLNPMITNNELLFGSNESPIGYYPSSLAFEGTIDDIAMWNRELTPAEVSSIVNVNSYLWSTGATTSSINITPSQTTTYYCTISNGISSCTDSVTITVLPGATPYYADTDGDSYGDSLLGHFCVAPAGGLTDSSDCDGNNPLIYPGAPEVCNSIDDDCDGIPDDGLAPVIGPIGGNNMQCIPLSSGSASFSIAPVPGANSYFWLAPSGTTITSGQGTTGVTIAWNTAAAHDGIDAPLTVTVTGACGQLSSTQSINVHLQISVPVKPSSISGPVKLCPGDSANYSVAPVSRARTYTWTLPSGLQFLSGQGTNIVRIFADATYQGGVMAVSASNACGTGSERQKTLSLNTPSTPLAINGLASGLCEASGVVYSVPAQTGISSFQWTAPTGAQIVSGQGSSQITVNFSSAFSTGSLTVQAINTCGPSLARSLALTAAPAKPGVINGPLNLCPGSTGVPYSVPTVNGTTAYNWSVFTGAIIASGIGTKNITIDVPLTSSSGNNITVNASNTCGSGPIRALNGISVATSACARLSGSKENSISIFPNPSTGLIRFQVEGETPISLQLYDMLGKCILSAPWKSELDARYLSDGLYVIRVFYQNGMEERLKVELQD